MYLLKFSSQFPDSSASHVKLSFSLRRKVFASTVLKMQSLEEWFSDLLCCNRIMSSRCSCVEKLTRYLYDKILTPDTSSCFTLLIELDLEECLILFLKNFHKMWTNLIFLQKLLYFMAYHSKIHNKVSKFCSFWLPVNFYKLLKTQKSPNKNFSFHHKMAS